MQWPWEWLRERKRTRAMRRDMLDVLVANGYSETVLSWLTNVQLQRVVIVVAKRSGMPS